MWKDHASRCNDKASEMTNVMKEMAGKGYSFEGTKVVLLVNVIREDSSFFDMIVDKSIREPTDTTIQIRSTIN